MPPNPSPTPRFSNKFVIAGSFYDESGFLKREVFIETAEAIADQFQQVGLTQTSLRKLYYPLKQHQNRLRASPQRDAAAFGPAREALHKLAPQVAYQLGRGIIKKEFKQFVDNHLDLASTDDREFIGFVELFTSVIARLRPKS